MKTYKIKTQSYLSCLNDKESLLEVTAEEIQKLIAENPEILEVKKDGKPKHRTEYWYLDSQNSFRGSVWDNHKYDNYFRDTGNFFLAEEECTAQQAINNAKANVMAYIRDNELGKEFVSGYGNSNYYIRCQNGDLANNDNQYSDNLPQLGYLKSKEACHQVIDNNTADLNLIYGIK